MEKKRRETTAVVRHLAVPGLEEQEQNLCPCIPSGDSEIYVIDNSVCCIMP